MEKLPKKLPENSYKSNNIVLIYQAKNFMNVTKKFRTRKQGNIDIEFQKQNTIQV